MEMQNLTLQNLKKGIKTAQGRIAKGLEGKKLAYALRYIKGAKTRIRKIKNELKKSSKIYKIIKAIKGANKKVVGPKKSTKINKENKNVFRMVKGVFKNLINEIKEIKNERDREKDFLKRWEDLENINKWED